MARVPLYIEFSGKTVLVIGGGYVGTKRALKFLDAGSHVVVIALKPSPDLLRSHRLGNMDLVIADASRFSYHRLIGKVSLIVYTVPNNDELRLSLRRMANDHRVLFNDATNAGETEVVVPFEGEVNGIRIAITTEGKSGVAASAVRDYLISELSKSGILNLANTWFEVKRFIKSRVSDVHARMRLYMMLKGDKVLEEYAMRGDVEAALKYVEEVISRHAY